MKSVWIAVLIPLLLIAVTLNPRAEEQDIATKGIDSNVKVKFV